MAKNTNHPGFKAVAGGIAKKEGIPIKNADAILASASRKASPAAKKANPALGKVSDNDADDKGSNYGGMARKGY